MFEELRERAVQLINQEDKIERVVKGWRTRCVVVAAVAFTAGFAVGMAVPFEIKALPTHHSDHPNH